MCAFAQTGRGGLYQVDFSATPRRVPADGQSQARLRVELRDQSGRLVPDGTQFVINTDLGNLSLGTGARAKSVQARTTGGFAIVFLTSVEPGTATVTIVAADSRQVGYVDFLPEGEVPGAEARVLDIRGGWVGYGVDIGVIEARDRAVVRFGNLVIEAGEMIQIDIERLQLRAQGVIARRGDMCLEGVDLFFDITTKRGTMRRFGEEAIERICFDALGMRPLETEWEIPHDAFRIDRREGDGWMVARSISLFLHEKIVLRHAALWVQDQKIFSFPAYWVIGLPGYTGTTNSQAIGVTSSGDLALDFPFFYRVTDTAAGSVKVQRGAPSSAVTSRRGWSLALEEEYRDGDRREGSIEVTGIPRSDWGVEWRDARPIFGDGMAYFNVAMPDHRSFFSDASIYTYRDKGRLNIRGYYDEPKGYESSYGLVGDWLGHSRPIGDHNLFYRTGLTAGMRKYTNSTSAVGLAEFYSELSMGQRSWGSRTTLMPMISDLVSWDSGGYFRNTIRGDLRLTHRFSNSFHTSLDYSALWQQGDTDRDGVQHLLGFDMRAFRGRKWTSYLNASYDISQDNIYSYMSFDYFIDHRWRWGLTGTYYDFQDILYKDLEISLGRSFGGREINLNYSTDTGRIWVGLGGFGSF